MGDKIKVAGVVLPFATAFASLIVGVLVGGTFGWVVKPDTEVEVEIPRDYTEDELAEVCLPEVQEKATALEEANVKVTSLSSQVREKETRVKELQAEMDRRAERGRELYLEFQQAKEELAQVKLELQAAEEEKEVLIEELTRTVEKLEETEEELEEQVELTGRAKEDALVNKYYRFVNDAQLEICEKGNRKKLGKCREAVTAELERPERRDKFAHCVRSGQATPSVHEMEKGASMPQFAEYINEDDKIVKGWYLLLCDPTLPEADGFLNEEHLPPTEEEVDLFDLPADVEAVQPSETDDFDDLPEEE